MTALILTILNSPMVLALLGGIAAALGFGIHQRRTGAKAERQKQAEAEAKARDIRDEVQSDIGAMSPDHVRAELAKRARK